MTVMVVIVCDVDGCDARVDSSREADAEAWGPNEPLAGWIDGVWGCPEGWTLVGTEHCCPEHSPKAPA